MKTMKTTRYRCICGKFNRSRSRYCTCDKCYSQCKLRKYELYGLWDNWSELIGELNKFWVKIKSKVFDILT